MTVTQAEPSVAAGVVELARARLGARLRTDVPLGALTTYRVGGPGALGVEVTSVEDLVDVAGVIGETGLPVLVLGRGSNLLVADGGFSGLVVSLATEAFGNIVIGDGLVEAGSAVQLPVLARQTAAAGLTGLEWAVGVPGSVGGAVRMNAGGHGADTAATLERCRWVDLRTGAVEECSVADLAFGYRSSAVGDHHAVVSAVHRVAPGERARSERLIRDIVAWRRLHQPGGQNAGSVFTNPPGSSAGALIDACGLRGHRRGTASVSDKHANFIQADPGGSAGDVAALIDEVRTVVEQRTGVRLGTEIRPVGFPDSHPVMEV